MQKTALLETIRVQRKVLEMQRDRSVSLWLFVMTWQTEKMTATDDDDNNNNNNNNNNE